MLGFPLSRHPRLSKHIRVVKHYIVPARHFCFKARNLSQFTFCLWLYANCSGVWLQQHQPTFCYQIFMDVPQQCLQRAEFHSINSCIWQSRQYSLCHTAHTVQSYRTCLPVNGWVGGSQPVNAQNHIMVEVRQYTTLHAKGNSFPLICTCNQRHLA